MTTKTMAEADALYKASLEAEFRRIRADSPEFDRYGYANGATDRGVGTRRRSECGHCLDRNRVRPGAVPGEREPSRVRGNVQASWAAVSGALRLCHGGRCRRAHPRFHSTLSHLLQVVRIHRDAGSVTHVFSGTSRYIEALLAPFGRPWEMGVLDYGRDLGHLSVSDHPAALTHLIVTGQIGVGDRVLMVNNGAGMSLTVAVIRIENMPQWPDIARLRRAPRSAPSSRPCCGAIRTGLVPSTS